MKWGAGVLSELELESKLEATTVVQRVGDLAECRRAQVRVRVGKLGRVEEVNRLGAKGEGRLRAQRPRAGESGVHVADASSPEGVEPEVAARIVRLDQREGRTGQARLRSVRVADGAAENRVIENIRTVAIAAVDVPKPRSVGPGDHGERESAFGEEYAGNSPSAGHAPEKMAPGGGDRVLQSHSRRVGLIERTRAFEILRDRFLRLAVALARLIARGHVGIGATGIDGLTEPVGRIQGDATPSGSFDVDPRRVEVCVRGVLNPAEFEVPRVGAPVGNSGRGLRDAGYMHGPVREPNHKELVGAAADVTELDVPGAARQRIPTEVVFVRVGRLQVGRHLKLGVARAGPQVRIHERVEERRRLDLGFEKPWRIPTHLLKSLVVDVAELKAVRGANDAGTRELPRETELGRKRLAVAIEVDFGKVVHLPGTGDWLVAQTEVSSQIGPDFPDVAREVLLFPPAKTPVPFANADTVTAGNTQAKVGDSVAAEIGAEVIIASVAGRLTAVVLIPDPLSTRGEGVVPDLAAVEGGEAEAIQAGIDVVAVGRKFRVGVDPALDQAVGARIGGERHALRGERHQHIAVHAAPKFLSGAIQREMCAAPQAKTGHKPVVVFMSGLHT